MEDFFEILFYVVLAIILVVVNVRKVVKQKSNTAKNVSTFDTDNEPIFPDVLKEKTDNFPVEKNIIAEIEDQKLQPDYNLSSNLGNKEVHRKEKDLKNTKSENITEKEHIRRNMFRKAILYSAIIKRPYN